jgi:hypothetical protein
VLELNIVLPDEADAPGAPGDKPGVKKSAAATA